MSDKYDKDILEQMALIDEDAKHIEVSDRVKPENMMKRIDELEKQGYFEGTREYKNESGRADKKKHKKRKWSAIFTGAGATVVAASLVAAILIHQPSVNEAGGKASIVSPIGDYAENMRVETSDGVYVLSSYKELNEYVVAMATKRQNTYDYYDKKDDFLYEEDMMNGSSADDMEIAIDEEAPTTSQEDNQGENTDYSDTNVRTEGVAEADVVKTDGKYIYYLKSGLGVNSEIARLKITSAEGADSKAIAEMLLDDDILNAIKAADKDYAENKKTVDIEVADVELIVSGDKLVAVIQPYVYVKYPANYCMSLTVILAYDISDKTAPQLINSFTLEGEYDSCRLVDGYVYVFANLTDYDMQGIYEHKNCTEEEAAEVYAPKVCGKYLPAENVYITDCESFNQYHIMATLDVSDMSKMYDVKAVLGEDGFVNKYVSGSNIYIITDMYGEYYTALEDAAENEQVTVNEQSEILRFSYENGKITSNGRVIIDGSVGDEFDIDEYNGYLRIAVSTRSNEYSRRQVDVEYYNGAEWLKETGWDYDIMWSSDTEGSALYIYDENLELTGSIPQLKENERVYGVRFDGDIAYVVTYEQTDPLFTIDLSDPANPKIMGELEIPGFSTYLHKWDENKLIGLGYDENLQIKISTFDITDKYDVRETDVCSLVDVWWTEALYNHKAIFVSPEKNLIGFSVDEDCNLDDDYLGYGFCTVYKIFSYVDGKLEEVIACPLSESDYGVRGMYIGDYIYIVSAKSGVTVYDMTTYEKVTQVK